MICPACKRARVEVVDSRDSHHAKRRRRKCLDCGHRFTSYEMREDLILQTVITTIETTIYLDSGALKTSTDIETVHLCACGNEARYKIEGDRAPKYCGLCDIAENEGKGERA